MHKWGKLHLRTLALAVPEKLHRTAVSVTMNGQAVDVTSSAVENRLTFTLACDIELAAGQTLAVEIG